MSATVILKFDDLLPDRITGFQRIAEITLEEGCAAGFGVIGRGFQEQDSEALCRAVETWTAHGIEIWNHGLRHAEPEFSTASYEEQRFAIGETQRLMQERCGITMTTFGSPYNNAGETTVRVLTECFPEITCALLLRSFELPSDMEHLTVRCNYEVPVGAVNYADFHHNYEQKRDAEYLVLQGHPGKWKDSYCKDFRQILRVLKSDGCRFLTPAAYSLERKNKSKEL